MLLTTDEALQALGSKLIADVQKSQRDRGLVSSGQSAESLQVKVESTGSKKRLVMLGLSRFRFQQVGRGPNRSGKPAAAQVEGLKKWLQEKGLNIPVYAIAVKQAREGTPVPNPFNRGGVLSEPLAADRVRGLAKVDLQPVLFKSAKSILFN
ncbi:hypothetical protein IC229_27525 [Spirosoma sp. BT702]|uniref:Uncharacterized protein n=1 Tax=Spirosoma profusum TaxID=2771354 RepID=A0A926Y0W8_9BACT|nr:hypothetical protein [Spirosoma profusum]MBD2704422.1 hypothetical protein [Spirosoma profusum]